MKDSRIGETLWQEWTGHGFEPTRHGSIVFFTIDHVDVEHEVVKRALASALQRDGSSVSLGQGFAAIEAGVVSQGYAGDVDGDTEYTVCDDTGETHYGDTVDTIIEVTWVEV